MFISAFEAGSGLAFFYWIAGLATQIFDNLVGREVEHARDGSNRSKAM